MYVHCLLVPTPESPYPLSLTLWGIVLQIPLARPSTSLMLSLPIFSACSQKLSATSDILGEDANPTSTRSSITHLIFIWFVICRSTYHRVHATHHYKQETTVQCSQTCLIVSHYISVRCRTHEVSPTTWNTADTRSPYCFVFSLTINIFLQNENRRANRKR